MIYDRNVQSTTAIEFLIYDQLRIVEIIIFKPVLFVKVQYYHYGKPLKKWQIYKYFTFKIDLSLPVAIVGCLWVYTVIHNFATP